MPRKKCRHWADGEVFSLDIPFNRTMLQGVERTIRQGHLQGFSGGASPDGSSCASGTKGRGRRGWIFLSSVDFAGKSSCFTVALPGDCRMTSPVELDGFFSF